MPNLKVLSFSGAATKIAAHVAVGTKLIRDLNYQPDIMVGVSSGSIVMLPLALGKFNELESFTTNLELKDIFSFLPVNEKGKVRFFAYIRALISGSLGSVNQLAKTYKSYISEEEFSEFQYNTDSPKLFAGVKNITNGQFELILLNDLNYCEMIETVVRSSTMPIYADARYDCSTKQFYADGGLRYHNAARLILNKFKENISDCISVYSRPEISETTDWGFDNKSIGRNISKTFDMFQDAVSENDEEMEIVLSQKYGINLKQIFCPKILKGVYDVDKVRLRQLFDESYKLIEFL